MSKSVQNMAVAACLYAAQPGVALAHAFLEHAVPGVGSTVGGSPSEIELDFTQSVVGKLSGLSVATAEGKAVAASRASGAANVLRVRLGRSLSAGVYIVKWHVVSVDTHATSGSFKFTVAP